MDICNSTSIATNSAAVAATSAAIAGNMVDVEIPTFIRTYKCGQIKRLQPTHFATPTVDPATGVTSKDVTFNTELSISARLYHPPIAAARKIPLLLYFHGGAFCTGSPFSSVYHKYLNSLVSKASVLAVSVDYRLAPEHPLPTAYDDSWEALRWAAKSSSAISETADLEQIFLAGDSSGANIAHEMCVRLGEEGEKVEGLMLIHPFFWGKERMGREGEELEGMLFRPKNVEELWALVCPGAANDLDDPRLNPLALGGSGLARLGSRRVLVSVAGKDFLRERGRAYYEKLVVSGWGGEVDFFETEGKDHVFHLIQQRSQKAVELMQRLVNFIRAR